ncbi:MAG: S9 family peptidase [Bacteroidales bacterium]
MTKKIVTVMAIASATLAGCCGGNQTVADAADTPIITKTDIEVTNGRFTPEIMHRLGKVSDPQLSPDGSKILYGVSYTSIEQNKGNRELYVMNVDGTNNTKITDTPKSEANARWINGGAQIAFLRGGQMYVADLTNNTLANKKQVSHIDSGMDAFEVSPDGAQIMYIRNIKADVKPADVYPDLTKSSGRTYTDLMYRHWDHFVENIPHTFIASFDGKTVGAGVDILGADGVKFELPTLPFGGLEQLSWSPDGKMIAYSCRKLSGKEYAYSTNADIYLYNVATKECRNLTEGMMGYDTDPVFSPDGKSIAWISMERNGYEADKKRLFVIDLASSAKKELTTDYKYNVESIAWAPASDKLYFSSCVNALTALFEVDANKITGKPIEDNLGTGSLPKSYGEGIRRITADDAWFDFAGVTPVADASGVVKQLITTNASMMRPNEIVTVDPTTGTLAQLTFENKATLEKLDEPVIEQRWMTTVDGKKMHTWIVFPPKFDKSKVYPALLMCLGGPQGTISQGFSTRWNYRLMASQGYIVILPNRRGTTAFGQPWCEQISGDYIGLNMQDYLTSVDNMKKEPYVGKVAASGASYGGYSIYYLAGIHKNRFSALIAHAGIFNQEQMYMMTEELWFPKWDNGGEPWDTNPVAKRHYDNSPHKLVKNWNTPILITHGEMDYRVPVEQGMAAFNAAQMLGVESKLLLFPEENHWILKPQNSIHWNREFFAWLDKYCK